MLEEHGAQVRQPDDDAPLTMVATGTLGGIRAAVAQFRHELVGAGLIVIEGEDRDYGAVNVEGSQCKFPAVPGDAMCPNHAEAMLPETGPAARGVSPGSAERVGGAQAEAVGRGPATGALDAHECADPDQLLDVEVVIIPAEARYHRAGCTLIRLLSSDDLEILTRQEAQTEGYVPCRACRPDNPLWAQPKLYPAATTRPATSPRGWRLALQPPVSRLPGNIGDHRIASRSTRPLLTPACRRTRFVTPALTSACETGSWPMTAPPGRGAGRRISGAITICAGCAVMPLT
jgi:hypothetical protein